jgi:hypothetical protein
VVIDPKDGLGGLEISYIPVDEDTKGKGTEGSGSGSDDKSANDGE